LEEAGRKSERRRPFLDAEELPERGAVERCGHRHETDSMPPHPGNEPPSRAAGPQARDEEGGPGGAQGETGGKPLAHVTRPGADPVRCRGEHHLRGEKRRREEQDGRSPAPTDDPQEQGVKDRELRESEEEVAARERPSQKESGAEVGRRRLAVEKTRQGAEEDAPREIGAEKQ